MATKSEPRMRYKVVSQEKADGATYTPRLLADFVASQIVLQADASPVDGPLRVLDPAVGDGELLLSLLRQLDEAVLQRVEVHGFDTNAEALDQAASRLSQLFPEVTFHFTHESFLEHVLENYGVDDSSSLFPVSSGASFDFVIANPPYVRTQIMGTDQAQALARQFGLSGRVDLYQAFLIGMAQVMRPGTIAGIIVSNRFMTTKSGSAVRQAIQKCFQIRHVWDLGDSKLFDAAVLPAVLLLEKRLGRDSEPSRFTSLYETTDAATQRATNVITALSHTGTVEIDDGRRFAVKQGHLTKTNESDAVWRVACDVSDSWLEQVLSRTWGTFRDIGKVRVGVKTCADKVFIRRDWSSLPLNARPELLRPLITHHIARCFRAETTDTPWQIIYPHESVSGGRRAIDLAKYPQSLRYLEQHRSVLEDRKYVLDAGRQWFEIWVPQDPARWAEPKLVFRDISEKPTFWIDTEGSIVNGDCYWLACDERANDDLLWLACAVANSTFIEAFYDHRFNNKLYSGRRRFITQYVEQFPLPNPELAESRRIIDAAKQLFERADHPETVTLRHELDRLIWSAFGLPIKEIAG